MNITGTSPAPKGGAKLVPILAWVLIAAGVLFAVKYFQDRNNDITIRLPKVEVR